MIRFAFFLVLGLAAGSLRTEAATQILRVWTTYREAESFESVGELLGRGESTGGRLLARTQRDHRDGFYFLVRLRQDAAVPAARVRLELIMPGSEKAVAREFPMDLPAGENVLYLGVTGADWPGPKVKPVAWRVTLLGDGDAHLARKQSFLWGQSS